MCDRLGAAALRAVPALILFASSISTLQAQSEVQRALGLYQQAQFPQCVQLLERAPSRTAAALALLGQCYYGMGKFKESSEALERAVDAAPNDSQYWNWLGRAFGKRAETSFALMAPGYARRARQHFEKAVELDPKNLDAVDDLFEYYLQAPGFLGGGEDKAANLSETIRALAPARYHGMQARLAEKRKQFDEAERHWRAAADAAPDEAGRYIDLARFLARQGEASASEAAFEQAAKLEPDSARLKFNRARAYADSGRNTDQARQLLQEYLKMPLTPDDPPRAEAEALLKKTNSN